jgi:hypothetical protein
MEISKYNKAMQFLLKPKYLTKDFIIQEASDAQREDFSGGGVTGPIKMGSKKGKYSVAIGGGSSPTRTKHYGTKDEMEEIWNNRPTRGGTRIEVDSKKYQKGFGTKNQLIEKLKEKNIYVSEDRFNAGPFSKKFNIPSKLNPYQKSNYIYDLTVLDDPKVIENIQRRQVLSGQATPEATDEYRKYGSKQSARDRETYIKTQGGMGSDSNFIPKKETGVELSHVGDIQSSTQKITGQDISYAPKDINASLTSIDNKIRSVEKNKQKILESNIPNVEKTRLIEEADSRLVRLASQSDGFKKVSLSGGGEFGGNRLTVDPTNIFPGKTEQEINDFLKQYITVTRDSPNSGKVKPQFLDKQGNIRADVPQDEIENIKKSIFFNKNRQASITAAKNFSNEKIENIIKKVKLSPQEIKAINQSLNSGFNPMEFGRLFPNEAKIVKSAMSKIGRVALALELPLELAVESAFMANAIAGGDTFREAWADSLIGHLDPTLYEGGMFVSPKISGDDLKNLKLDISQSARTNIELEKSDETLQSLKDELESGLSMLNLEGVDEATTSEDYNSLRERIRNEQYRNDKLREGTSEASKLELANAKTEFESGRSANSFSTRVAKFASDLENMTDASGLNYDLRKGKNEDREVKKRNFDTVEDQANFFINNFPDIKQSYEKNKDLFATPAEFYSAIREQNPKFNEKVIEFMMNPEYADEGTRGLDFSTRAVDQTPKVIDDVIDTYATGGRVGLSGGGRGGWIAKRIQEINKLIKSKKAGPEDFFDEVQLLEKAKELNLNEGQVSQILKQQQQQRIDNYKKLPIQGDPALNSRLPYDSDTTPRNYKKVKTTSLEGSKADYGTYKFTGQESMDDLYELERQGKLTREDMNVYDPRYMEYLDAQIINKEQLYTRKEWEKTPETIKNRTRGRIDPDWEEANFGEDFDWDQARSIEIDQTQKLKNFDTSGRTKQASGGRIGLNIDDIMNNYATGGRVGFEKGGKPPKDNPIIPINPMIDEGPQDPGKRTFLKGVGAVGLGAVALGTGLLKLGKTLKTKTALKVLANPAVGQAEWFAPLVDKILLKGIRLEKDGKKLNTHVLKENNKTLTLTETDTSINIKVEGGGAYDDPFDVDYLKPGEHLGSAGRYQIEKPTFQISESRPQYYSSGPEDIELELSEHVATGSKFSKKPVEELLELRKGHSGILSDVEGLEKIAMGKVKDSKLAKKRGEVRDKLNKNPTEDRYTNTDQYYDDIDQVDYD